MKNMNSFSSSMKILDSVTSFAIRIQMTNLSIINFVMGWPVMLPEPYAAIFLKNPLLITQ